LQRMETAASFFFTVPGPKMLWHFGEIGYDYSQYTCPDGSVDLGNDVCKQSAKPVRWDYLDDPERIRLHAVFTELIKLRNQHDVFKTDDFELNARNALKSIHLNNEEMNVTIVGNFDLKSGKINPEFQHTGTWYDYFSGTSREVENLEDSLLLKAGEYRVYTDVKLEKPELPPGGELPLVTQHPENSKEGSIMIYPNPAKNMLHVVSTSNGDLLLEIYSLSGQLLVRKHYYSESDVPHNVHVSLDPGIYICNIHTPASTEQSKLIIE
jgi:hypothetical protein